MATPDLNLLVTLNVVLAEGSVARAARRLRLSPSAMSRAVARLRETTGDPLLVRAGRGLVPTPRAIEIREHVGRVVDEAEALLRPVEAPDLAHVARTFTIRTSDGFVENFGPGLVARARREAPGVRLRFIQKAHKDNAPLRDGFVDLETGVVNETTSPELREQPLFQDTFVGVVRRGHPLAGRRITRARYLSGTHVAISRGGLEQGPIDPALRSLGLTREVVTAVGGFSTALALARASDVIASVPARHTGNLRTGMFSFPLPFPTPHITVSMIWHPRMHADPIHRWLRGCLRNECSTPFTK